MLKKNIQLFISSLLIGLVVGGLAFLFGSILLFISSFRQDHFEGLLLGLPLAGIAIVFVYQRFGKRVSGGMKLLFEVELGTQKKIPLVLVPLIISTTWLTHLFGGSAGREGVAVQVGGTIGTQINQLFFKGKLDATALLLMGMAAGFGGLFQTPLTACVFALEVFRSNKRYWRMLPLIAISSVTASQVTGRLGLEKFRFELEKANIMITPKVLLAFLVLVMAIYSVGKLFAWLLHFLKTQLKVVTSPYQKIVGGSIILMLGFFIVGMNRYAGLGTNLIDMSFYEQSITPSDWLLKLMFTVMTLAIGFQGGEVTPLFAIGATLGTSLGTFLGLPVLLAAALGYVGVFTSASFTYLTGIALAYEVFGSTYLNLFVVMIAIFYIINWQHSIYPIKERSHYK